jgi:two-component system OmpR family response regulator
VQQSDEALMATIKKKILVVDDDAVVIKALTIKLAGAGYEVISASDGTKAVTSARSDKPDAIILDLNFPDDFGTVAWDGYRIMEWLNRLDKGNRPPIIVISSSDAQKVESRVKALGAVSFFQKPFDFAELESALERLLSTEAVPAN